MTEGDVSYKVRITPELIDTMMTRDVNGRLITWEASEPDGEGYRVLIFTVHPDDSVPTPYLDALKRQWVAEYEFARARSCHTEAT